MDTEVEDDLLRLIFTACHPVLPTEARVALTLRVLGGLSTLEIARAFLVSEPTMAQRLVRAKKALAKANVPFEVPHGDDREARLGSVLEVIYLIFNEGYMATAGDDLMRPALCDEALRVGRILAELAPTEPEVHGLVALMEIQSSRTRARTGRSGQPILLLNQNRGLWNQLLIHRGLAALKRAIALGGRRGPYVLQASIAACHARARTAEATDWAQIAALYRRAGDDHAVAGRRAESRRWRWRWRRDPTPGSRSSMRSSRSRRWRRTRCCRRPAAISSPGSAVAPKPRLSSSAPRR